MKLKTGVISRARALELAPLYVAYAEGDHGKWAEMFERFERLKVGSRAVTYTDGQFVLVRVSSIRAADYDADGPIVRVSNGEYGWRVDGDRYAWPVPDEGKNEEITRR